MTARVSTHKDLDVWQVAMELVEGVYTVARSLPASEKFGLASQLRRAAVSVPSNIAEGAARSSSQEYARYLVIARGSLAEIETQLILVERLRIGSVDPDLLRKLIRVRQMLVMLIRRLSK